MSRIRYGRRGPPCGVVGAPAARGRIYHVTFNRPLDEAAGILAGMARCRGRDCTRLCLGCHAKRLIPARFTGCRGWRACLCRRGSLAGAGRMPA